MWRAQYNQDIKDNCSPNHLRLAILSSIKESMWLFPGGHASNNSSRQDHPYLIYFRCWIIRQPPIPIQLLLPSPIYSDMFMVWFFTCFARPFLNQQNTYILWCVHVVSFETLTPILFLFCPVGIFFLTLVYQFFN